MISQRGNVLFLILIAVALFAALSYAVTASSRSGGGDASKETAHANAAAIIQYATTLKNTITRLKLINGCTDYTLDFSNTVFKSNNGSAMTTANSNAPANKKCNVFDPAGGNVTPVILSPGAIDTSITLYAASPKYGHSNFKILQLNGVGTDGANGTESANDIVLWIENINRKTCLAINDILGVANPGGEPPPAVWSGPGPPEYNSGDLSSGTSSVSHAATNGFPGFCRNTNVNLVPTPYNFIYALVER